MGGEGVDKGGGAMNIPLSASHKYSYIVISAVPCICVSESSKIFL